MRIQLQVVSVLLGVAVAAPVSAQEKKAEEKKAEEKKKKKPKPKKLPAMLV